jgi:hypothetical protein
VKKSETVDGDQNGPARVPGVAFHLVAVELKEHGWTPINTQLEDLGGLGGSSAKPHIVVSNHAGVFPVEVSFPVFPVRFVRLLAAAFEASLWEDSGRNGVRH